MSVGSSSNLSATTLQLSRDAKQYVHYNDRNEFRIYLEKIDNVVCPQKNYRIRHLTPVTLHELLNPIEAAKIVASILQYNYNLTQHFD